MPMPLSHRLFRYFALALATAHLVVFTGAPVLEASVGLPQSGIGVIAGDETSDRSIPSHDPSTCIACQILSSIAAVPQPATILLPAKDATARERFLLHGARPVAHPQGFLSRAPPAIPA